VKEITSEDLRWNLTRVGAEAAKGVRWQVTFHGKPRFAIVPIEDLERIKAKSPKKPAKRKPVK
jgi:antitoxin (DNA-binding transcriptional repressor) of toxin-antitoxin stability system